MATQQRISRDEHLDRGRAASRSKAWAATVEHLMAADTEAPLDLDDLERLGIAAHLVGRDDVAVSIGMRGFTAGAAAGEVERAARAGFWTGMGFAFHGEWAQAGAWFGRSTELIEKSGRDCVETGYLMLPMGIGQLEAHDGEGALATFEQIAAVADRFGDADLVAFGRLGRGQALIELGERDRGIRLLDEAMAAVTAGEVTEAVAGTIYCTTVEQCHAIFDLRRAQEWTTALTAWCDSQPDLVFRGRCQIYRAELMRFHGDWIAAADEVERARTVLSGPPISPAIGEAYYEEGELRRLQGRFDEAERAYADGSQFGRRPEPGLALLRLAQGRAASARSVIARALEEDPANPRLLEAALTIALARQDVAGARTLAERLRRAGGSDVPPLLDAIATRAEGEVLLAEGEPAAALRSLRAAWDLWQELDGPFDTARVRVGIARACRALGDEETARLETAAARRSFEELGAAPALAELDRLAGERLNGLSAREEEVLRHIAAGQTNREIADELGISERTVDRHVSNLYTKLDVSTRAAATAWAFEHQLA
jgi:DNA-binding CsgD family transcriptional regulator